MPVALVTGGGTGIGRATAIELSRAGYRIAVAGRRRALLDGRADEDLGEELDGVLLGARPRPRSVPEGLPGLAIQAA